MEHELKTIAIFKYKGIQFFMYEPKPQLFSSILHVF